MSGGGDDLVVTKVDRIEVHLKIRSRRNSLDSYLTEVEFGFCDDVNNLVSRNYAEELGKAEIDARYEAHDNLFC